MTEQELTVKLKAIVDSQRSTWLKKGDKMNFVQENFTIKNAPVTVSKINPINL